MRRLQYNALASYETSDDAMNRWRQGAYPNCPTQLVLHSYCLDLQDFYEFAVLRKLALRTRLKNIVQEQRSTCYRCTAELSRDTMAWPNRRRCATLSANPVSPMAIPSLVVMAVMYRTLATGGLK